MNNNAWLNNGWTNDRRNTRTNDAWLNNDWDGPSEDQIAYNQRVYQEMYAPRQRSNLHEVSPTPARLRKTGTRTIGEPKVPELRTRLQKREYYTKWIEETKTKIAGLEAMLNELKTNAEYPSGSFRKWKAEIEKQMLIQIRVQELRLQDFEQKLNE